MYVDDLLVVGDDRNIQKLVDELSKKLRLKVTGKLEEDRICFLGKVIEKRKKMERLPYTWKRTTMKV